MAGAPKGLFPSSPFGEQFIQGLVGVGRRM